MVFILHLKLNYRKLVVQVGWENVDKDGIQSGLDIYFGPG